MVILITGGSGFVGKALTLRLLEKGCKIYSLSRHPPAEAENLIPLVGDITEPDLGLKEVPKDIQCVHHLAGLHSLGQDKEGLIWRSNVDGTKNVVALCEKHNIPHLLFTSSAFTQGRNCYEQSKAFCEWMVKESKIPKVTIFKPSIIMGTEHHFYPGHFAQFVLLLVKAHGRAEPIRKKIEGTLRLPIIEPVFRMKANPEGKLNLVPVDAVAGAMADIDKEGIFWLTNPAPPTMQQIVEWVGEFIMVKIKIIPTFKPTPIEIMVEKLLTAFVPYLWGGADFPCDLKECPPITREFIHQTIKRSLA